MSSVRERRRRCLPCSWKSKRRRLSSRRGRLRSSKRVRSKMPFVREGRWPRSPCVQVFFHDLHDNMHTRFCAKGVEKSGRKLRHLVHTTGSFDLEIDECKKIIEHPMLLLLVALVWNYWMYDQISVDLDNPKKRGGRTSRVNLKDMVGRRPLYRMSADIWWRMCGDRRWRCSKRACLHAFCLNCWLQSLLVFWMLKDYVWQLSFFSEF